MIATSSGSEERTQSRRSRGVVGMRPGAAEQMEEQLGPLQSVYGIFQERTGLDIPEVEGLLAG